MALLSKRFNATTAARGACPFVAVHRPPPPIGHKSQLVSAYLQRVCPQLSPLARASNTPIFAALFGRALARNFLGGKGKLGNFASDNIYSGTWNFTYYSFINLRSKETKKSYPLLRSLKRHLKVEVAQNLLIIRYNNDPSKIHVIKISYQRVSQINQLQTIHERSGIMARSMGEIRIDRVAVLLRCSITTRCGKKGGEAGTCRITERQ